MAHSESHSIRRIFNLAMDAPGDQRPAILDRECGGDAELRRRIEAMIAGAEDDRFLSTPTLDAPHAMDDASANAVTRHAPQAASAEGPGTRIGQYKLLQQIGEGGFGSVFMAEQERPVARKVALKIIKLGMDTRQVVARFEQERQALALMDHPHVARVFDAGSTDTGRPFFVMELCTGESITKYCDKHKLAIAQRLELFVQVCQAVQHAHQKGLIHRDIKPNNVLVSTQDGKPFAKIIDFGIAKATASKLTEKTLFTEHKQLIGTPEYMSPEQAEGSLDIDTRSDVYSLGVLLYELLAGTTPFDSKSLRSAAYAEIQRIIREVEPPKPSTRLMQSSDTIANVAASRDIEPKKLGTVLRGELDWIVMKSLEKDRSRRYESAIALGADLQRYLAGDAVVAAPPSSAYLMRKFVRRNKGPVTAGIAVALALLLGAAGFAWQAQRVKHERDNAVAARNAEAAAREDATRKQQLAETVNAFFSDQILGRGDPHRIDRDHPVTLKEAIDLAARELETLFADQPLIRATIHDSLGAAYRGLGQYDAAEHQFQEALSRRRAALGPEAPLTLKTMQRLASTYSLHGAATSAEPIFTQLVEASRRTLGDADPITLGATTGLANVHITQMRHAQALPLLLRAFDGQLKTLGERNINTLETMNSLTLVYQALGEREKAMQTCERQVMLYRETFGNDHPETTASLAMLGGIYEVAKRFPEAIALLKEADTTEKRVLGEDHPERISTLMSYAHAVFLSGDRENAMKIYDEGLRICRASPRVDRPLLANTMAKYGGALVALKRYAEAEQMLLEAYPIVREAYGPLHFRTVRAAGALVKLYELWGKPDDAAKWRATTRPTNSPSSSRANEPA